jgi:hypothetical protein
MNNAEQTEIANALIGLVDENIGKLSILRKATGLDGQINKVDFSINRCKVTIKNEKTLDVEVFVKSELKRSEYASLEDHWIDVKPRLQSSIEPGLKAKETYELLYAVLLYDATNKPDGRSGKQRANVQAALEGLISHYTKIPMKPQNIFRYQMRDSKTAPGSEAHEFHQLMFLQMNRNALHALLFSSKEIISELDAKSDEFAAGNVYTKTLHGVQDMVSYGFTPPNAQDREDDISRSD